MGRKGISVRAGLWLSAAALSLVVAESVHAESIGARPVDIPSQPLATTLTQIGRQTAAEVVFASGDVRGKSAPAVHGRFTAEEALQVALEGSSLNAQRTAQGAYLIKAEASAPGGAGRAAAIEEIIVTAQKREERLIETPISVSVLSSENLDKMAATQFRDFANTVPGLTFTSVGAGFTQVSLRGVTSGIDVGPTVGIYVDEVPYGSSSAFAFGGSLALDVGLFDIDRIEVLRGPQGTLYGASTMGGLLKYVSNRPDTGKLSAFTQASLSSTHSGGMNYGFATALNLPISPGIAAVRVSGFYSRDGGYIDNLALAKKDVNRSDIYGGRVDLLLTPTDNLSVRINGFMQDIERDGQATADFDFAGSPEAGSLDQRRPFAEPFNQRFRLVSGTINYDFGGVALTSISSYQYLRVGQVFDISRSIPPVLAFCCGLFYSAAGLPQAVTTKKFTQELRLSSSGSGSFEWILGGFYTHEKSKDQEAFAFLDLTGAPAPNIVFTADSDTMLEEIAAFGDLTYHFSPKFDVTGGVRWATNRQTRVQDGTGFLGISSPQQKSRDSVVTYLANARYHISDHATAYLRYATGYRPGGPNLRFIDPVTGLPLGFDTFGPDRLKSYEAGIKAETADRRFAVDLAGYYNEWSNIQVLATRSFFPIITNAAGGATVGGAEVTLSARPVEELQMTAAFAYQDSQISKDDPDLGARAGDPLPNVPRYTGTVTGDYTWVNMEIRPTIGLTVRYVSGREASFDAKTDFPQYHLPEYAMIDLRAGLTLGPVDAKIFVRNLLDERAQFSAYTNRGNPAPAIAQPRTIGITASARF